MSARLIAAAILLSLGVLPGTSGSASGQFRPEVGKAFVLFRPGPATAPPRRLSLPPASQYPATYYFEGAVIGTSLLATTGAWFASDLCESSDCTGTTVAFALGSGVVGGIAGAIIGGQFGSPHPRPLHGHGARAALVGAVAGALWGFGVFPHFCLNGCNPGEVRFGLSNAAVGALAGVVVGQ
jgi:hypothetical protein